VIGFRGERGIGIAENPQLSLFPDVEGLAGFVRQKIRLHW
jgi:hypothetical protein